MEKTKEIRQSFSKAVISGSRSGSGKLVFEHYDSLIKIWGGSANSKPLPFGLSSSSAGGGSCADCYDTDGSDFDDMDSDCDIEPRENNETLKNNVTESGSETEKSSNAYQRKRKTSIILYIYT